MPMGFSAPPAVTSAAIQVTTRAAAPSRCRVRSSAVADTSSTARQSRPRAVNASTRCESPPPISTTQVSAVNPAASSICSDTSGSDSNQLRSCSLLVAYTRSQCSREFMVMRALAGAALGDPEFGELRGNVLPVRGWTHLLVDEQNAAIDADVERPARCERLILIHDTVRRRDLLGRIAEQRI